MSILKAIQPEGWAPPKGYANGMLGEGRTLFVGGQIGWNAQCEFETDDLVAQVRQTLENVVAIVRAAGGEPENIATMTWYYTSKQEYLANLKGIGAAYRAVMGRHFPAMAAVEVKALIEDRAKVEIQAIAVLPQG
jgi:enamine deaminase RidA (YjgF/YER057c/UK114 family)